MPALREVTSGLTPLLRRVAHHPAKEAVAAW